jgi:hypothetical protein
MTIYNALHVSSTIFETVRSPTRYWKERLLKDSPKEIKTILAKPLEPKHNVNTDVDVAFSYLPVARNRNVIASLSPGLILVRITVSVFRIIGLTMFKISSHAPISSL